jgi:hypothetical protein
MMRARIVAVASLGFGSGALALGCALDGRWLWCLAVLAVAGGWSVGRWRRWPGVADAGLAAMASLAAAGVLLGLSAEAMLLGLVGALCAWDLDHFLRRMAHQQRAGDGRVLERRHLGRILAVAGLSLILGLVALRVDLELSLLTAVLLGLLAVLGLGRAARYLYGQSG